MSYDYQPPQPPDPYAGAPGYPPGPPAPPTPQGTNGMSIAGFVLAFLFTPLGLILSIVGLVQARKRNQKGRGLAIAGIVISTVSILVGVAAIVVALNSGTNLKTVADPGCTAGKDVIFAMPSQPTAADLQKAADGLNSAAAKASDPKVRDAMKAVADDYTQIVQAVNSGQQPPSSLQSKLESDANQIDALCTIGGSGK